MLPKKIAVGVMTSILKINIIAIIAFTLSSVAFSNESDVSNQDIRIVDGKFVVRVLDEQPKPLNDDQKSQLYLDGRIIDDQGRIWNVKIIPGTNKIKSIFIEGWQSSGGHLKRLFQASLYEDDVADIMKNSAKGARWWLEQAKEAGKFAVVTVPVDWLVDGIAEEYDEALREIDRVLKNKPIGWQAVVAFAHLKAFGMSVFHVVTTPALFAGGAVIGTAEVGVAAVRLLGGLVGSVVLVAWQPIAAVGEMVSRGSLVPGAMWVWNGTAWVFAKGSSVPTQEDPPWVVLDGTLPKLPGPKHPENILRAVRSNNIQEVRRLIAKKVDLNKRDRNQQTPLMIALWNNFDDVAKELIAASADLNAQDVDGWTAAMVTVLKRNINILKLLAQHQADFTIQNTNEGKTALDLARERDDQEAVKVIEDALADLYRPRK